MDMVRRTAGNKNRSWMETMNQSATFRKVTEIPTTLLLGLHCLETCASKVCAIIIIITIIIIVVVSCHRPFLPGTSLEPAVTPTAQASSFTLQYFPYCVMFQVQLFSVVNLSNVFLV
jgi:hypothetical protein